jgi:hypothetical protein
MKIQPGVGYTFDSSSRGFTIDASDPFPSLPSVTLDPLTPVFDGEKITVKVGTVNRYVPTINGVFIDTIPAPTLNPSGQGYVLVKIEYQQDKFFPRTAIIIFYAGSAIPDDTNTESFYPLAKVNSTSGNLSMVTFASGNLAVNRLKAGDNIAHSGGPFSAKWPLHGIQGRRIRLTLSFCIMA